MLILFKYQLIFVPSLLFKRQILKNFHHNSKTPVKIFTGEKNAQMFLYSIISYFDKKSVLESVKYICLYKQLFRV